MVPTAIYAQISSATRSAHAWIDKDTNHQVIQLTLEPGSKGLYFNENAFTPDGKQMVYIAGQNIKAMELATYKTRLVAAGPFSALAVAHTSAAVYFTRPGDTGLYLAGINTERIIKIADLPARATIDSLNADDTLAAGTYTETDVPEFSLDPSLKASSVRAARADARLAAHIPMVLFTVDLKTGKVQTVLKSTDWISHVQFSPKDTHLLMYCHEGLWYKVDRIWTVRTDGNNNRLIHQRTVNGEIAGHEFWDADGVTIWYDLQIPRGQNFYLASYNTDTGARKWYSVERDAWSIHYNATADDKLFCGDGGDYAQVAKSKNGQWIELLSPRESPVPTEIDQTTLVQSGFMVSKHLVNMSRQDYSLEPNVRFSPDKKWVIFSSNMSGSSYVYAVEVAEAATATTP
jgi:oligogalacturonide lyase